MLIIKCSTSLFWKTTCQFENQKRVGITFKIIGPIIIFGVVISVLLHEIICFI